MPNAVLRTSLAGVDEDGYAVVMLFFNNLTTKLVILIYIIVDDGRLCSMVCQEA